MQTSRVVFRCFVYGHTPTHSRVDSKETAHRGILHLRDKILRFMRRLLRRLLVLEYYGAGKPQNVIIFGFSSSRHASTSEAAKSVSIAAQFAMAYKSLSRHASYL